MKPRGLDCLITLFAGDLPVTFALPVAPDLIRTVRGVLVAEVRARGKFHHYRVRGTDGTVHFVYRHWLDGRSRCRISAALYAAGRPEERTVVEVLDDIIDALREQQRAGKRPVIEHRARGEAIMLLEART